MLLEVRNVDSGYGFFQVLWDISLLAETGEYLSLIGANGAGKSTLLKTIAGLLAPSKGQILFNGRSINGLPANKVCQIGINYISEQTNLFNKMTVGENLAMGAYAVRDKKKQKENLDFVFGLFPTLQEREKQLAGTMSGGERKMLAIGRGIMSTPSVLLVDEPSSGLAPQVAADVFRTLNVLRKNGLTLLVVEENVRKILNVTNRGYILEKGKIVLEGRSSDLTQNDQVRKVFLGI